MGFQNLYSDLLIWLGGRFMGLGIRNVGVAMIILTFVLFYTTGLYNKIVDRKQNKGY